MRRAAILVALITIGCATTTASSTAAIRQSMMGFIDALNALDAERMDSYFADDVTAFFPLAQAARVDGRANVTQIFRNFVERTRPTMSRLNIVPDKMTVDVSGELGVVTFQVGATGGSRRTFVFRRIGGRWLISHMHASDFR